MAINSEQKKELELIERRTRRVQAAVEEWVDLIDKTRETMPEYPATEFDTTLRIPFKTSKRSH
jgi:hypothetical protein